MKAHPRAQRSILIPCLLLALVVAALAVVLPFVDDIDTGPYLYIAWGRMAEMVQPFTSRFGHPFLARTVQLIAAIDLPTSFLLIATAALVGLAVALASLYRSANLSPWLVIPVMLTPALVVAFQKLYLPDLVHAALVACFLLALARGWIPATLVLIPILYCVREATLLLCIIAIVLACRAAQRRYAAALIAVTILSIVISTLVSRHGQPNVHHLPTIVYLALKLPFNFLQNVLGIRLWTNNFGTSYVVKYDLPAWLRFGSIRQIGRGEFLWTPLLTPLQWLSIFGVLPTVLLHAWRRRESGAMPLWLRATLWYGVISFFLGPMLGASVPRLIAYGWPAFWIATPILWLVHQRPTPRQMSIIVACHLMAAWLPQLLSPMAPFALAGTLVLVVVLHLGAWQALKS